MKRLKNTLVNLISGAALLVGLPSLAAAETTPPQAYRPHNARQRRGSNP